jgi:thiosulfate/3-mercaptopyruvate sulfurtransferase
MRKQLLLAAAMLMLVAPVNASANDWFKDYLTTEKAALTFAREVQRGGYQMVGTEELKGWLDAGTPMLLVDTMPLEASYKKNHIPGAVPFEFPIPEMTELDEETKARFLALLGPDQERRLVFYCGYTKCTRSHNAAMWAVKLGYRNAYRHPGGILAWKQAKYPASSSR